MVRPLDLRTRSQVFRSVFSASSCFSPSKFRKLQLNKSFFVVFSVADSYGSWPWDAVTEGNRYSWGSHYSCLEVDPGPQADFRGQHCTVIPFRVPVASLGEEGREDVLDMLRSARANLPAMVSGKLLLCSMSKIHFDKT